MVFPLAGIVPAPGSFSHQHGAVRIPPQNETLACDPAGTRQSSSQWDCAPDANSFDARNRRLKCAAHTKAPLSAVPSHDPKVRREKILLVGDAPSPIDPPKGSAFGHRTGHPRYRETVGMDLSLAEIPPGHLVAAAPCRLEPADMERILPSRSTPAHSATA